jgi:hypothetical protein
MELLLLLLLRREHWHLVPIGVIWRRPETGWRGLYSVEALLLVLLVLLRLLRLLRLLLLLLLLLPNARNSIRLLRIHLRVRARHRLLLVRHRRILERHGLVEVLGQIVRLRALVP